MKKLACLLALMSLTILGCIKNETDANTPVQWDNGHPAASVKNCAVCHESDRPTISASKVMTTDNGRDYTVHFHNIVPTGFNEDPGIYNDCSTCHTHAAGWGAGNFGPVGGPHLKDSLGTSVSQCTDCHDYPANFWLNEHSNSQSNGRDCSYCHLVPGDIGATEPGGFGGF